MFRKMILAALLLGCIPLLIGCDGKLKGTESTKGDDKKAIDKSAPAPSDKSPKQTADDAVEFPTTDPLIAGAIQSRKQFAGQEEALLDRLDELRSLLASAKSDPARIRQSVDEFMALAQEIRRVVVKAGEAFAQLDEGTGELSRSMKHLGNSYRSAAALFRDKARDYSNKKLRDQLNGFADDYEAIAKTIPERLKSIQEFQKSLPKLKLKVREANAFLDDGVLFLSSHPGIGADPRERYSAQFETFVLTFSDLIRTVEEFRKTLRERAISKVVQNDVEREAQALKKIEDDKREAVAKIERERQEQIRRAETLRLEKLASVEAEDQRKLPTVQRKVPTVQRAPDDAQSLRVNSSYPAYVTSSKQTSLQPPLFANPSTGISPSKLPTPVPKSIVTSSPSNVSTTPARSAPSIGPTITSRPQSRSQQVVIYSGPCTCQPPPIYRR